VLCTIPSFFLFSFFFFLSFFLSLLFFPVPPSPSLPQDQAKGPRFDSVQYQEQGGAGWPVVRQFRRDGPVIQGKSARQTSSRIRSGSRDLPAPDFGFVKMSVTGIQKGGTVLHCAVRTGESFVSGTLCWGKRERDALQSASPAYEGFPITQHLPRGDFSPHLDPAMIRPFVVKGLIIPPALALESGWGRAGKRTLQFAHWQPEVHDEASAQ